MGVLLSDRPAKGIREEKKRPSMHQREAPKVLFSLVFTLSLHSPLLLLLLLCCPPSSLLYCLMIFPSCSLSLSRLCPAFSHNSCCCLAYPLNSLSGDRFPIILRASSPLYTVRHNAITVAGPRKEAAVKMASLTNRNQLETLFSRFTQRQWRNGKAFEIIT